MKELFMDDDELVFDDENIIMTDEGTFKLEPGDPGYVDPNPPPASTKKARNYMASNPTAVGLKELMADGQKLCDGLHALEVAIGMNNFKESVVRPLLESLISKDAAFTSAESAETEASIALQALDEDNRKFIGDFITWMVIHFGWSWSDQWLQTGLPDNKVAVPTTIAKRFAALELISQFLTGKPQYELTHPLIVITAARAHAMHEAYSDQGNVVDAKHTATKAAKMARDAAEKAFRKAYRATIGELEGKLSAEDPRWYQFGLSRPADPQTPEAPRNLKLEAASGGRVIATVGGARRAHSFNFYKQVVGVDPEPVKVGNTTETHMNIPALPVGSTVKVTATGVNDAGEGPACDAVSVLVT